jgi:hypothetical protein
MNLALAGTTGFTTTTTTGTGVAASAGAVVFDANVVADEVVAGAGTVAGSVRVWCAENQMDQVAVDSGRPGLLQQLDEVLQPTRHLLTVDVGDDVAGANLTGQLRGAR